jgi:UDP-N-acetylmuramoyl-tripeptide--D-alanyl-D-alanine ligase
MTVGRHLESNLRYKTEFDDNGLATIKYIFQDKKFDVKLNIPGESSVQNASFAALIGFLLEVPEDDIKSALEEFEPKDDTYARMKVEQTDQFKVINDTYNSNPSSARNAINISKNIKSNHKIAVFGDMKELGKDSQKYHEEIIKLSSEAFDLSIFYGDEFNQLKQLESDKIIFTNNKSEIIDLLKSKKEPDTLLLVKGSRSMKMEEIIQSL